MNQNIMNNPFPNNPIGNSISDFINLQRLGSGQFGTVFKMKSKKNGQIYAVKIVEKPKNNKEIVNLKREEFIMGQISHPNIVQLYGTFEDYNNCYFISEFIEGTNLESFIKDFKNNNPNSYINQEILIDILRQILLGLEYLHGNYILHRDIKPDNILIYQNNKIKITDFGISAIYKEGFGLFGMHSTRVGRPDYVCPEILYNQPYDYKCDIYSLGYTMYYAMNFCLPEQRKVYGSDQQVKRYFSGKSGNYYDPRLIQLIDTMYRDNPNERPTASQALKELESITNNNNKINITNLNYFHSTVDNKLISSMKSVLYFFHGVDNMKLIMNIVINKLGNNQLMNNNFALLFFNMYDMVYKRRNNQINNNQFNESIIFFINQLKRRNPSINGIRPVILYYSILTLFKEDYGQARWDNKIGQKKYIINGFPQNMFPNIYSSINDYVLTYRNPLIDVFYFIIIECIKCPNCNSFYNVNTRVANFLSLDNKEQNSIMNLVKMQFGRNFIKQFMQCNFCGYRGNLIEEKYFFDTPDYLVLDLYEEAKVTFDNEIDLSEYVKTDMQPPESKKYDLFAVINKEINFDNNLQFIISIKEKGQWIFCSGDNIEKCGPESIGVGIPSCAIYKRNIKII